MSATRSRRQRQWEEREKLILETARRFIQDIGFLGLTMSELADAVEYSVGTLYRHFETKEDLLVAMAVQSIDKRAHMFEQIKQLDRISRDRIYGILIVRLLVAETEPETFDIERLASSPSIWTRANAERYRAMVDMEQRCSGIVADIIAEAKVGGELDAERTTTEDIIFGLWSISIGFHRLMQSFDDVQQVGLLNAETAFKKNYCMLLDGYSWQPLSGWDAETVEREIRQELDRAFVA